MPRRALRPGDIVAACPRPQVHWADSLDPASAIVHGVLIPHARYRVVARWETRAKSHLVVGLPDGPVGDDAHRVIVDPAAVRLWGNPIERRWQKAHAGKATP